MFYRNAYGSMELVHDTICIFGNAMKNIFPLVKLFAEHDWGHHCASRRRLMAVKFSLRVIHAMKGRPETAEGRPETYSRKEESAWLWTFWVWNSSEFIVQWTNKSFYMIGNYMTNSSNIKTFYERFSGSTIRWVILCECFQRKPRLAVYRSLWV